MRAVIILSGGMDSATLLAKMHREGSAIQTLTFDYGSKHNKMEIGCAEKLAQHYKVPHQIIKLPFINELFKSDLLKSGGKIPEGHYEDKIMRSTVVPFRNGIMLSIAVGYAESIGFETVAIGNHSGDHAIYPDCRSTFIGWMNQAAIQGTYAAISIYSPFIQITKSHIVKIGDRLGILYEKTYSCYQGGEIHCGKCGTCIERKEAFKEAGVKDPTTYKE